jgi:hypothetical protein
MKPEFIRTIVDIYVEGCEYSMVVNRKNIEMTVITHLWGIRGDNSLVKLAGDQIEDWVSMILTDLEADDRVEFVVLGSTFNHGGRDFVSKANYIINKKYDNYLEALMAEIEGR